MMNKKLILFTKLCAISTNIGMSKEKHLEKKRLAEELVVDGILVKTDKNSYDFINDEDSEYFKKTINEFLEK